MVKREVRPRQHATNVDAPRQRLVVEQAHCEASEPDDQASYEAAYVSRQGVLHHLNGIVAVKFSESEFHLFVDSLSKFRTDLGLLSINGEACKAPQRICPARVEGNFCQPPSY